MNSDRAMLWTVAVAASLGLHALIIVALLGFGAFSGEGDGPASEQPKKPEVAAAEQAKPREQTSPAPSQTSGTVPTQITGTVPAQTPAPSAAASAETSGTVPADEKFYIVKSGDNLSKIANLDGSSIAELAELNGKSIKELSMLRVGQQIRVKNGIN